jgi:sugar transferase (PEP-CTERM system associated)
MTTPLRHLAASGLAPIALESAFLVTCVLLAAQIPSSVSLVNLRIVDVPFGKAALIAVLFQLSLYLRDIHDLSKASSVKQLSIRFGQALGLGIGATLVIAYFLPHWSFRRESLVVVILAAVLFLSVWHTILLLYLDRRRPRSNILVLGTGPLAKELVTQVLRRPAFGFRVCGFLSEDPSLIGKSIVNPKVKGLFADLAEIVSRDKVDRIIVELQDRRSKLPVDQLLSIKTKGVVIEEATGFYERVMGKIAISNLKPSWIIFNGGFKMSRLFLLQKWLLASFLSLLLLVLLTPIMLLVTLLIKLDSTGPVFLRQDRVGKDGKIFTLYKFRSMYEDAERKTGPVWAARKDTRVTRVGKVLRRIRLDELPQLWNVLRGDMTLIGPRPERPSFVAELLTVIPFYGLRHAVKPGITGWAQINYHYANSVEDSIEKLQYDLFYLKHMSFFLDLVILFQTVKTVLVERGS